MSRRGIDRPGRPVARLPRHPVPPAAGRAGAVAGAVLLAGACLSAPGVRRAAAQSPAPHEARETGEGVALAPKRSLTLPTIAGCVRATPPAAAPRRDESAARAAAARARELALVGDREGARAGFARAAALDPASPQLAYDLGRAAEEAGDARGALGGYCQTLTLAPTGPTAPDARARVARLTGGAGVDADRRARESFVRGVAALDAGRPAAAQAAFDSVLRATPNAPEASYNRGLAALALGRDADAARDLAAYVASPAAGADRGEVLRAVDALRRPALDPGTALARGALPGFGQLYTGRPAAGIAVFAATAAAVGVALHQQTSSREQSYVDPFGHSYTSPVTVQRRPALVPGLAAAALFTAGAAYEASRYAAGAAGRRPTVSVRTAVVPGPGGAMLVLGGRF